MKRKMYNKIRHQSKGGYKSKTGMLRKLLTTKPRKQPDDTCNLDECGEIYEDENPCTDYSYEDLLYLSAQGNFETDEYYDDFVPIK